MPFVGLHHHLPDLARREARTIVIAEPGSPLPVDAYTFIEAYCDEPGCDCRRVMLMVESETGRRTEAVIAYGWEDLAFYERWMRSSDPREAAELQGPVLNLGSPATRHAPAVLDLFREVMLADAAYVARLQAHYRLFRVKIESPAGPPTAVKKIGRNERCPCGSGRKWKVCCRGQAGLGAQGGGVASA